MLVLIACMRGKVEERIGCRNRGQLKIACEEFDRHATEEMGWLHVEIQRETKHRSPRGHLAEVFCVEKSACDLADFIDGLDAQREQQFLQPLTRLTLHRQGMRSE